ncbi:protein MULTIPLE CHLOROPLAST DIVISION SITE 1 isoform X2 [Magnolia sinica]|uniref:protein MULTIPLE CHLOROPLAST DIVISION SITE 1 isoform X2 n=1 Tax=Magnolia sinica TaxID=86752 RepID=UPI00265A1291|nr:protein MULTIPLE CHLOROPLAST DIVISION SITE 1 isoform X2 [Magnolia sinica]
MTLISTAFSLLQSQSASPQLVIFNAKKLQVSVNALEFQTIGHFDLNRVKSNSWRFRKRFSLRAAGDFENSDDRRVGGNGSERERWRLDKEILVRRLKGTINAFPPVIFTMKRCISTNSGIGLFVAIAFLVIAVRQILARKPRYSQHGSVADLVKRGQLRSDRRGISRPLKYEDPFDNPLVKVGKSNSTVEMCGKVYRLAPVTLTEEQQSIHQKRRSRAYQWKRPTVFLKEGDPVPPDVDPDTVRWIPTNHPFATTVNNIDEDMAQNNVFQKDGVPFRIKAEHEALQRKLEALQSSETHTSTQRHIQTHICHSPDCYNFWSMRSSWSKNSTKWRLTKAA